MTQMKFDDYVKVIKNNNVKMVKKLWNDNFIRMKRADDWGDTILHVAVRSKNLEIIEFILSKNVNVNEFNLVGISPLHIAAGNNNDKVVSILMKHGADINLRDDIGSSPLHNAAWKNNDKIVSVLMKHGADIDLCDIYGNSPLHYAARNNNDKVVSILMKHGADINLCNIDDETPLQLAVEEGHTKCASVLKKTCTFEEEVESLNKMKQQNKKYDDSKYFDGQDPKFLNDVSEFLKEIYEQKKWINISLPILADVIKGSVEYLKDKLNTGSLSDSLDDYAKKISNIFVLATNIFRLYKCERSNEDNKLVSTPRLTNILNQQLKMCKYIQKDKCYSSSNIKQRLMQAILYCVSNHLLLIVHNPNLLHVLEWMDVLEHVLDDEQLKKLTRVLGALNLGHIYRCNSDIFKKKETRIKTVLNPVKVALDNDSFEIEYPGISKDFVKVLIDNNDS